MSSATGPTFRLPAETAAHERCLVAWPTRRRTGFWRGHVDDARDAWAEVVRALARFEPVLVVADEGEGASAEARLRQVDQVEVVELPIDDSWIRDSGPLVTIDGQGGRRAVDFRFNAWGEKDETWDRDDAVTEALAARLALAREPVDLILEGGSIAVDGHGLLVTTERCLLNPNRNPGRSRAEIEHALRVHLGVDEIVWLPDGLTDDDGTDGHVDNVVSFHGPRAALLQSTSDEHDPDFAVAAENRRRLTAAGVALVELDVLPRIECFGEWVEVPYANFYIANGGVVVPVTGHPADDDMLDRIGSCFPGREVVGVPGAVLAYGGGGVHCITMQVPLPT